MEHNNELQLQLIGRIYAIKSKNCEKFYIGSTTQRLEQRLSKHKNDLKRYSAGKHNFVSSFEILNHGDYYIQILEEGRFQSKTELHKREGELIKFLKEKVVNKVVAGRKVKEYYQENKEKILAPVICACGATSSKKHITRHLKSNRHQKYLASLSQ